MSNECDGGGSHSNPDEPPTLESELANARQASGANEPDHAILHMARALAVAPTSEEALALADEVLELANLTGTVLHPEGEVTMGMAAMHARQLGRTGQLGEAINLALQLATFEVTLPFLAWVKGWLNEPWPKGEPPLDVPVGAFAELLQALPPTTADAGTIENARCALLLLDHLEDLRRPMRIAFLRSGFLRRLGEYDHAIKIATIEFAANPDWVSAVELGAAYRGAGRWDQAAIAFEKAAAFDPTDVATRLDLGDAQLAAGETRRAAATYDWVLERNAENGWADASRLFVAHLAGDTTARSQLELLASTGSSRAQELLDRM